MDQGSGHSRLDPAISVCITPNSKIYKHNKKCTICKNKINTLAVLLQKSTLDNQDGVIQYSD